MADSAYLRAAFRFHSINFFFKNPARSCKLTTVQALAEFYPLCQLQSDSSWTSGGVTSPLQRRDKVPCYLTGKNIPPVGNEKGTSLLFYRVQIFLHKNSKNPINILVHNSYTCTYILNEKMTWENRAVNPISFTFTLEWEGILTSGLATTSWLSWLWSLITTPPSLPPNCSSVFYNMSQSVSIQTVITS